MSDRQFVSAVNFARRIGKSCSTVARWRRQGRGPKGWVRIYDNQVVYPADEVEIFIASLTARSVEKPVGKPHEEKHA